MTLTQKLDRIPPCVARILATANGKLATDAALMKLTGWTDRKLVRLYRRRTWSGVKVGDVDAFLAACGLSWSTQREKRWLLKLAIERGGVRTMRHLRFKKGQQVSRVANHLRTIEKILSK